MTTTYITLDKQQWREIYAALKRRMPAPLIEQQCTGTPDGDVEVALPMPWVSSLLQSGILSADVERRIVEQATPQLVLIRFRFRDMS